MYVIGLLLLLAWLAVKLFAWNTDWQNRTSHADRRRHMAEHKKWLADHGINQ